MKPGVRGGSGGAVPVPLLVGMETVGDRQIALEFELVGEGIREVLRDEGVVDSVDVGMGSGIGIGNDSSGSSRSSSCIIANKSEHSLIP